MYRSLLIIIIVPTPCTVSTREKFWLTRDSKRHTINMKTDYSSLGREPIFLLEKFSDVLFFTEYLLDTYLKYLSTLCGLNGYL